MQCHFMAKLFAMVVVVLAHNHLKNIKEACWYLLTGTLFSLLAYRDFQQG